MFDYSGRNCHAHQMKRKGSQYLIILMKRDKQQQPQHLLSNERRVFKFISLYFSHIHYAVTENEKTRFKEKKGYHNNILTTSSHTHTYIYLPSTPFSSSIYLL